MDEKPFTINPKMCRLCPSEEFLLDLYVPMNSEIREVLNLFVNIEDENSTKLPKFICEVCKHIVESIIDFKNKCKLRDTELREKTQTFDDIDSKNPIKIEAVAVYSSDDDFPIEEITIKEEVDMLAVTSGRGGSDFSVEYLDEDDNENNDDDDDEVDEEENKDDELPNKKPRKKRDRTKKTERPCELCKNVYSTWGELNEHKKADHLQCPVCLKTFNSYGTMLHHKKNVHAGGTHCHICGKEIPNRLRLLRHIRKVHDMERNHKCEVCGKDFFHLSKLKEHLETHRDTKLEICDFENCGKMFKTAVNLKCHRKRHFPNLNPDGTEAKVEALPKKPPQTIICQCCGKILKTSMGYDIHMRVHRNEKPFECQECDKKFRDKRSLTVHGRTHKNIRPFQCDLCPKRFYVVGAMKNHKISIHETEMKHECQICGKRTKIKSNLTLHMKTHGIVKTKNDLNIL